MASIFVHISIAFLSVLFPEQLSFWPLLISSLFADSETVIMGIFGFLKKRNLALTVDITARTGILHSILGSVLVSIPVCILTFIFMDYADYLPSLLLGLASHLILDIPAHPVQMMFWPFKVYEKNPWLLKMRIPFIQSMYPYRPFEHKRYEYLAEFHWTVISLAIPVVILLLVWLV